MNSDNKIIDVSPFRFRKNPMFQYSLFDPATQHEWLRLEKALGKDAVLQNLRSEVAMNPSRFTTLEIGRTDNDQPILFTAFPNGKETGWFAGVAWTDKGEEQYRQHAKARAESIQTGNGMIAVLMEKGKDY
jgi:hypothetical protein